MIDDIFLRIYNLNHRVEEPEDEVQAFRNNKGIYDTRRSEVPHTSFF